MFSSNLIQNLLEAASVQAEIGDLSPILPKKLYLSGRYVPMQPTLMRNNGITHVLSVTRMPIKTFPDSFEYKWYDLDDMSETNLLEIFDEAHQFISSALEAGGACLVHCDAGVSRSSTMVISFIMRYQKLKLKESFLLVREKRPIISPNMGFIRQLIQFEQRLFPETNPDVFRVFYFRHAYSISEEIKDQEILEALQERDYNFPKALALLRSKVASNSPKSKRFAQEFGFVYS